MSFIGQYLQQRYHSLKSCVLVGIPDGFPAWLSARSLIFHLNHLAHLFWSTQIENVWDWSCFSSKFINRQVGSTRPYCGWLLQATLACKWYLLFKRLALAFVHLHFKEKHTKKIQKLFLRQLRLFWGEISLSKNHIMNLTEEFSGLAVMLSS